MRHVIAPILLGLLAAPGFAEVVVRPAISGVIYDDRNGNGWQNRDEINYELRRVYADINRNGIWDHGITTTVAASGLPKPIPDVSRTTHTLTVSGNPNEISGLKVRLDIAHTWDADLDVALISPWGQRFQLFSDVGGSGDNFTGTVIDDLATSRIANGQAPFTGNFIPQDQVNIFVAGHSPNGVWTLEIVDDAGGDVGTLLGWSLIIDTAEPATRGDASGRFRLDGLAHGTYQIRMELPPGWTLTQPAPQPWYEVTFAGVDVGNVDFGHCLLNRISGAVFHDANVNGVFDATEIGLGGWSVFSDDNWNGVRDQGVVTSAATELPMAIPDLATVESWLNVGHRDGNVVPGIITDVDVSISLAHTYTADLDIVLVSPGGERIPLLNDCGGWGDNMIGLVLDDAAATPIASGVAPFTGRFRPAVQLARLNGSSPNGWWVLEITDDAGADVGTLTAWSLTIRYAERGTVTATNGSYHLDVPAGRFPMFVVPQAGWTALHVTTLHDVMFSTDSGATVTDLNFPVLPVPTGGG